MKTFHKLYFDPLKHKYIISNGSTTFQITNLKPIDLPEIELICKKVEKDRKLIFPKTEPKIFTFQTKKDILSLFNTFSICDSKN